MKNNRNHSMVVGNKVLTGMTASEVKKLSAIMNVSDSVDSAYNFISVDDYIAAYSPKTREWTSKAGTKMIAVEILHDIIDREEDEMSFPVDCMFRNSFSLK